MFLSVLFALFLLFASAGVCFPQTSIGVETSEPWFVIVMAIIAGVWEVVGRVIPSVGQITILGKLIEILSWLSNFFNRTKKKGR